MHLVVNHVTELDHIDNTHSCRLVEPVTCTTVTEISLTISWKACLICVLTDVAEACTVEDRSAELHTELLTSPSENSLVDLTEVHT